MFKMITHKLYTKDGEEAGLYNICEWWIEIYPSDIFINEPKPIVEIRSCMQNILAKRNHPKHNSKFMTGDDIMGKILTNKYPYKNDDYLFWIKKQFISKEELYSLLDKIDEQMLHDNSVWRLNSDLIIEEFIKKLKQSLEEKENEMVTTCPKCGGQKIDMKKEICINCGYKAD